MDDNLRQMKYPYTMTAKIRQFPYKYYFKHSWMFRYCFYASFVIMPVLYKFQNMSKSPENVKKWAEIDRQTFEGH